MPFKCLTCNHICKKEEHDDCETPNKCDLRRVPVVHWLAPAPWGKGDVKATGQRTVQGEQEDKVVNTPLRLACATSVENPAMCDQIGGVTCLQCLEVVHEYEMSLPISHEDE